MSDLPHTSQIPDSSQIREVSLSRLREAVDAYGEMVHPDDVRYLLMDGQAAVLASGCKAVLSAPTVRWCSEHRAEYDPEESEYLNSDRCVAYFADHSCQFSTIAAVPVDDA